LERVSCHSCIFAGDKNVSENGDANLLFSLEVKIGEGVDLFTFSNVQSFWVKWL